MLKEREVKFFLAICPNRLDNCHDFDYTYLIEVNMDELIEELRRVMEEKKLSAITASRFIEVTPRQVYRWLKYEHRPTMIFRKAIKRGIDRMKRLP
ncbi:MAG: hypothetical protein JSW00_09660 [Thermoplasmata archaeon]|nr:MAG: hypothetical protein JSW00_09660 [Thermoplasmata archaeon]